MCPFWLVKGTAVSYFLSYLHIFAQCQTFFVEFTLYVFLYPGLSLSTFCHFHFSVIACKEFQKYHISCPINYHHTFAQCQTFFVEFTKKKHFFFYLHSAIFTHAKNSKSSLDKKFKECLGHA